MSRRSSLFRTAVAEARYLAAYDAVRGLWPVPAGTHTVPTSIGTAHAIVSGPPDGPPVVLLPMAAMTATMWFPNVGDLSREYRVVALDTLNDLGKSVPIRPCRDRASSAAWLLDALDALGLAQVRLVGASYGGWLALNLALTAPERVTQLALLAPAGGIRPLGWKFFATMGPAALLPFKPFIQRLSRPMTAPGFVWHPLFFEQVWVGLRDRSRLRMADFAYPAVFPDDALRSLRVPVLLLYGEHEIICRPRQALARARRLIPNLEADLIPGVGHGLSMEQPAAVDARLLAFFGKG